LTALAIQTARVFQPLLAPARYKGAWGGRGSGKSHFFAEMLIEDALAQPGLLSVCIREVQKSLADSAKRLIERKLSTLQLGEASGFKVYRELIRTPGNGVITFQGMADHTADSIKSLEGFQRAWVEEAQSLTARSMTLLRPTIRDPGSQLWFSWNPRRRTDAVDVMLRSNSPTGAAVVQANWSDNPWFPAELEQERRDCLRDDADQYRHIWEGDYVTATTGAYFVQQLAVLRAEKRLGVVAADPLLRARCFWDLGVSDSMAIWIAQFVGREIRVLDYIEGAGQPLSYYADLLRSRGYGAALCVLPHDGAERDSVRAVKFEDHLRDAGFEVQTVKNQGKGAAMLRIEAARRLFPHIWINAETTVAGVEALGAYHERKDDGRGVGLGPEHDWSSHAADAFGLMCVAYEARLAAARDRQASRHAGHGGWMR
jgi:phage terminase large subunit